MVEEIRSLLSSFKPISLEEMEGVKLMTRSDQKFQCSIGQLPAILIAARTQFQVLEIRKSRLKEYESLYLDTPDHEMYRMHHNGHLNRYKIRIREYKDSHEFFLEIKFKDNHRKTTKRRVPIDASRDYTKPAYTDFLNRNSPYTPAMLQPVLSSGFCRMTLVNNLLHERVTIDINPFWHHDGKYIGLPGLVIIEVKSVRKSTDQGFGRLMRDARLHPNRLSKYCTGTVLLYPHIKHNRFKEKMLHLSKLEKPLAYA